MIEGALTLLNAKGSLILSTNHSAYSLKAFKNMVKKTLDHEGVAYQIDEVMGLPKDFKTHPHFKPSKYLKLIFVTLQ